MGVKDYFVFDGVSSRDFGAIISGYDTFGIPERDADKVEVPGRNGDLTFDNGRWKNEPITYKCLIYKQFIGNYNNLVDLLASKFGYFRLEDTIHPDVYRIAKLTGAIDFNVHGDYVASGFKIKFDCKPQKYLKIGEKPITFTDDGVILNPTNYEALPLIRVYSTGVLQIGSDTITINNVDGYVDIDCDLQDAYKGTVNCNDDISGSFPRLKAGRNNIVLNSISKIDIIPRWWRL